jgi:hypothetical protein
MGGEGESVSIYATFFRERMRKERFQNQCYLTTFTTLSIYLRNFIFFPFFSFFFFCTCTVTQLQKWLHHVHACLIFYFFFIFLFYCTCDFTLLFLLFFVRMLIVRRAKITNLTLGHFIFLDDV